MVLRIDTTDREKIIITLKGDNLTDTLEEKNSIGSEVLLGSIIKLLKRNKADFKDLKSVEVETGPGSFTGIRVGASVANALGFALNIPVNNKELETDFIY